MAGANSRATALQKKAPQENVYLFVPNLIGYARVFLAIISLYYMPKHPITCSSLYSLSCLLDAFDGYAARYLRQSTRYGAVLDMVTDRCTTSCLFVFLATAFPKWVVVFQALIVLDMASHYTHMCASAVTGGSHKDVEKQHSRILSLYYTNKAVLFILCAFNEAFFIALYLLAFCSTVLSPELLESKDNRMSSTIPWTIAVISFPGMLLKQIINLVQLGKAASRLVDEDIRVRREQALKDEL